MVSTDNTGSLNPVAAHAVELANQAIQLRADGQRNAAVQAAQDAVVLVRGLLRFNRNTALPLLAQFLNLFGVVLSEAGRRAEALQSAQEATELYRELAAANRGAFLGDLAMSLHNLGNRLGEAGRRAEALQAVQEAVALRRELAAANRGAFVPGLASSLDNLGGRLGDVGRLAEALQAAQQAVALYRELAVANRGTFLPDLTGSLNNLSIRLSGVGRSAEALQAAQEAVNLYRVLAAGNRVAFLPDLATSLHNLGGRLSDLDCRADALQSTQEAVELRRELAAANRTAFLPDLAASLNSLGGRLSDVGRPAEALKATQEALEMRRELAAANRTAFLPDLAASLNSLGVMLSDTGHRLDALDTAVEAFEMHLELATADRQAFLPDLARSLGNLAGRLRDLGRVDEAIEGARKATSLYRELVAYNRGPFMHALAGSLTNLGLTLGDAGRHPEALEAHLEARDLILELLADPRGTFRAQLAAVTNNLGNTLGALRRRDDAVQAAKEATELYRQLAAADRGAFLGNLVGSSNNLANRLSEAGRRAEALHAFRECGALLLEWSPTDPYLWILLARGPTQNLDTAQDLRDWHLPLLRLLTEHRELAFDTEQGAQFLSLRGLVASRVWELLAALGSSDAELLDEAVSVLVSTLHSPDLTRWLQAQGTGAGAALTRLKRDVIEADQVLNALMQQLRGGDTGASGGQRSAAAESSQQHLKQQIGEQAAKARSLREAFRTERQRLIDSDPAFRSAFELPGLQALRETARHADGSALLCLLDLPSGDAGTDSAAGRSHDRHRIVGALLHADGRRTRLLEFAGVNELAWHANEHRPECTSMPQRGPLRGATSVAASTTESAEPSSGLDGLEPPPPITDLLAARMGDAFWSPLQRAVQELGLPVERLHLCTHGLTQQLPLALRDAHHLAGVQVMAWPGLPYLRLAASTALREAVKSTPATWLVGHDCAWASEQPLAMVAVEAALLRDLLQRHGHPVRSIAQGAQLRGEAAALVACCHGGAEQVHFDHALHLGGEPLTVRQIVQEHIGPPLALLPACHAGRTDEDAAGNALGVAAAFMLSGTQVVAASSKAVPDLLQPWLSTLTVWHTMQGLPHHHAATLARTQFARLEFPEVYRSWLQQALPQALATIQPGGEEDEHIRGECAHLALRKAAERWPWEGDPTHLFSADRVRREEATRSVVRGILTPRGGEAGARVLAADAREMAAFVFVYGVAQNRGRRGDAAEAAASAESARPAGADGTAAHRRPEAGNAPPAASTAGEVAPRSVPDQPKAKSNSPGLLHRLRVLIGR